MAHWLDAPLPEGPIGEAWLISDRDDFPSTVLDGPLKGRTLGELIKWYPAFILGNLATRFQRFPLLLKYLDVSKMLSVQVHPSDRNADLIPPGNTTKTEGWVVLEATPHSRIYAGLKPEVTKDDLRTLSKRCVDAILPSFEPLPGQSVLINAGVVHSLGDGLVVLEVQQNSDVTFRLFDWENVDEKTGQPRALQMETALACVNMAQGVVLPAVPLEDSIGGSQSTRLLTCSHFNLARLECTTPFTIGRIDNPTIIVCISGEGYIEHAGADVSIRKGEVLFLPAALGKCRFRPETVATLLVINVPDTSDD